MPDKELDLKLKIEEFLAQLAQARAAWQNFKDDVQAGMQLGGGNGMAGATAATAAQPGSARSSVAGTANVSNVTQQIDPTLQFPYSLPAGAGLRTMAFSAAGQNTAGGYGPPTPVSYFSALASLAGAANPNASIMGPANPAGVAAFQQYQQQGNAVTQAFTAAQLRNMPTQMMSPDDSMFRVSAASGRMRGSFSFTAEQSAMAEAGYGGARLIGQGADLATSMMTRSGSHAMEQADMTSNAISSGIGLAVMGATGNPLFGIAAKAIADSALSPLVRYMTAPQAQREGAFQTLSPFFGAYYGRDNRYQLTSFIGVGGASPMGSMNGGQMPVGSLSGLTAQINARYAGTDITKSQEDVAAAFGSVAGGLFAGGADPFGLVGVGGLGNRTFPDYGAREWLSGENANQGHMSLMEGMVRTGMSIAGSSRPQAYESAAYAVTRRLGQFTDVGEGAKSVAPIYGSLPETGGNTADILDRFGAQDTLTYLRTTNDNLDAGIDSMALSRTSASIRSARRSASMKSLQARGSAHSRMGALAHELVDISSLPGGSDSLQYASVNAEFREAGAQAFEQSQMIRNEIPLTRLGNQRDILQTLPFAPASMMRNSLATISAERQQLSDLTAYERARRSSGQLSESEELQLTQRESAARLGIAQGLYQLSEGMENRLPELSAGRPSRTGRYNSVNLAASAVRLAGGYYRGFGAENGGQRGTQDSLISDLGFNESEVGPHSRSQGVNSQAETNSLLRQILSALQKNGNGGGAPSAPTNGRPGGGSPTGSMPGNPYGPYASGGRN